MVGKDYWIAGIIIWWLLTRPDSLCYPHGPVANCARQCDLQGDQALPRGGRPAVRGQDQPGDQGQSRRRSRSCPAGTAWVSAQPASSAHRGNMPSTCWPWSRRPRESRISSSTRSTLSAIERLVCIGNPLHSQGRFVDLIHQAARDRADNVPPRLAVNAIQIPSTESPDAGQGTF